MVAPGVLFLRYRPEAMQRRSDPSAELQHQRWTSHHECDM